MARAIALKVFCPRLLVPKIFSKTLFTQQGTVPDWQALFKDGKGEGDEKEEWPPTSFAPFPTRSLTMGQPLACVLDRSCGGDLWSSTQFALSLHSEIPLV